MDAQKLIEYMKGQLDRALSNCATLELQLHFARERVAELEAAQQGQPAAAPLHIVEPKPAA